MRNIIKKINVNGIKYDAIVDAAKAHDLPASVVNDRLKYLRKKDQLNQENIDKAFSKPYKKNDGITVNGVNYKTIRAAAEAHDIPAQIARYRLGRLRKEEKYDQDNIDKAFLKEYVPAKKPITVKGITYESICEAINANGLQGNERLIRGRIERLEEETEEAINECFFGERNASKKITIDEVEYESIVLAAEAYNLPYPTVCSRLKALKTEDKESINAVFNTEHKARVGITVLGVHYDSVAQAAEEHDIPYKVAWRRLKKLISLTVDDIDNVFEDDYSVEHELSDQQNKVKGLPQEIIDRIFIEAPKPSVISGVIKVKGIEYENLFEACNALGVKYTIIRDKLRKLNSEGNLSIETINEVFSELAEVEIDENQYLFISKSTENTKATSRVVDISKLETKSLGLLTLESNTGKIQASSLHYFVNCFEGWMENEGTLTILQKEVSELSRAEIIRLVNFYEENIVPLKNRKRASIASGVRNTLKLVEGDLIDGGKIKDAVSVFKTSLKDDPQQPRLILSESPDTYFIDSDKEIADRISSLRFNSIDELKNKIIKHLKKRTERHEGEWWSQVINYLKDREELISVKNKPLTNKVQSIVERDWLSLTPDAKDNLITEINLTDDEKLQLNIALINKYTVVEKGTSFLKDNMY